MKTEIYLVYGKGPVTNGPPYSFLQATVVLATIVRTKKSGTYSLSSTNSSAFASRSRVNTARLPLLLNVKKRPCFSSDSMSGSRSCKVMATCLSLSQRSQNNRYDMSFTRTYRPPCSGRPSFGSIDCISMR